jgi:hypothetical protein
MKNSDDEVISRLTGKTEDMVRDLASQGWEFKDAYWESGHNGDPYYDVKFKSPRMENFVEIGQYDWKKITKRQLLKSEASQIAKEWWHGLGEDDHRSYHDFNHVVKDALKKMNVEKHKRGKLAPKIKNVVDSKVTDISKIKKLTLTLTIE